MDKTLNKTRWLISCDESGVHGAPFYGFGTLWMKWQRRGDFARDFRDLQTRHGFSGEAKWSRTNSQRDLDFYLALVDYFFRKPWLAFHCFVAKRAIVKKELHQGSWDLARRKHFTQLLINKMRRVYRRSTDGNIEFRIYVDPIASSYDKADEVVEIVSNNVLRAEFGTLPVESVITRDSKDTPTIQLCDVLLGAVMEAWQNKATNKCKLFVQDTIAGCLGWNNLKADTRPEERKFNIWYFYDSSLGPREIKTRQVSLKYPLQEQFGLPSTNISSLNR